MSLLLIGPLTGGTCGSGDSARLGCSPGHNTAPGRSDRVRAGHGRRGRWPGSTARPGTVWPGWTSRIVRRSGRPGRAGPPTVLGNGPGHHRPAVVAAPGADPGRPRALAAHRADRRGRRAGRRGGRRRRLDPGKPGPGDRVPVGQQPGQHRPGAQPSRGPGRRRGPDQRRRVGGPPGHPGRDRGLRSADVRRPGAGRAARGPAGLPRRRHGRAAGERCAGGHRGGPAALRRAAGHRVRAQRAGQFRHRQCSGGRPGGGPGRAGAYATSLRADLAARLSAGQQLLRNPRLHASTAVRRALAAGEADSRLLADFAALAAGHPLRIIDFGAAPAGLGPGQPLRTADIAPAGFGTVHQPDNLRLLSRLLLAKQARYRPASLTRLRLRGGTAVLRLTFTAPSPLGLGAKG